MRAAMEASIPKWENGEYRSCNKLLSEKNVFDELPLRNPQAGLTETRLGVG